MGGESSPRNASRSQRSQTAGSATRESGSSGWPGARGSGGRVGGTADRASPHGRVPQPRGGARRPPGSAADGRGARRGLSIVDLRAAGMVPPAGQSERRRGSERATAGWTRLGSRTGTGGSPRARVHLRAAAGTCAQQFLPRIHKKRRKYELIARCRSRGALSRRSMAKPTSLPRALVFLVNAIPSAGKPATRPPPTPKRSQRGGGAPS